MDNTLGMCGDKALGQLDSEVQKLAVRQRACHQTLAERCTVD